MDLYPETEEPLQALTKRFAALQREIAEEQGIDNPQQLADYAQRWFEERGMLDETYTSPDSPS